MFRSLGVVLDYYRNVYKICFLRFCSNVSVRKISFECSICKKIFSWLSVFLVYKKIYSDVWVYKCNKCLKVFKFYSNLWNYKWLYLNIKFFKCDLCG